MTEEDRRDILNWWFVDTRLNDPKNLDKVYDEIRNIDKGDLDIPIEIIYKYKN